MKQGWGWGGGGGSLPGGPASVRGPGPRPCFVLVVWFFFMGFIFFPTIAMARMVHICENLLDILGYRGAVLVISL